MSPAMIEPSSEGQGRGVQRTQGIVLGTGNPTRCHCPPAALALVVGHSLQKTLTGYQLTSGDKSGKSGVAPTMTAGRTYGKCGYREVALQMSCVLDR